MGLPAGGTCTILTSRTALADDPSPLFDTVTVPFNLYAFPNDITAHRLPQASAYTARPDDTAAAAAAAVTATATDTATQAAATAASVDQRRRYPAAPPSNRNDGKSHPRRGLLA